MYVCWFKYYGGFLEERTVNILTENNTLEKSSHILSQQRDFALPDKSKTISHPFILQDNDESKT